MTTEGGKKGLATMRNTKETATETTLYGPDGRPEHHSNHPGIAPGGALAYKWNDDISGPEWVTEAYRLQELDGEDAPLSYTDAGLASR